MFDACRVEGVGMGNMNDLDYSDVDPKLNQWLPTQIKINGAGFAKFENPVGIVKGTATAEIGDSGKISIEFSVEHIETEIELNFPIWQFFSSDKPKREGNEWVLYYPPKKQNPCLELRIETDEGDFVSEDVKIYSFNVIGGVVNEGELKITFKPTRLICKTKNPNPPKYWAVPLVNFVSDFSTMIPELAKHPLRIYYDGDLPDDIPEDKYQFALMKSQNKNRLIGFNYLDKPAFIERLPDYKARIEKLENGKLPVTMTSVMVGSIGQNDPSPENYEAWFPFRLLDLLSFVTGRSVSLSWIEFLDENGDLVYRFHGWFDTPSYVRGIKVIDEGIHRGTGLLLTNAMKSEDINQSFLRTAMVLTTKGGKGQQTMEDQLGSLCRALETLCVNYGIRIQNLLELLDDKNRQNIQKIITNSAKEVQKVLSTLSNNNPQRNIVNRIHARLTNVANIDKQFGQAVVELLDKFNMPDAKLIDQYFEKYPRKDGISSWAGLISKIRGDVVHAGYMDFRGGTYEFEDVWTVQAHLHEILVRILLKILGYSGKYQPTTYGAATGQTVDWVTERTHPGLLGFGKEQIHFHLMRFSTPILDEDLEKLEDQPEDGGEDYA